MPHSHSESKAINKTLTMQIIVAVAQDIENLTQHSHEEIDEMRQQMKARAEVGEASRSANCGQMMDQVPSSEYGAGTFNGEIEKQVPSAPDQRSR